MPAEFKHKLQFITGHRESRQAVADFIIKSPNFYTELIDCCFLISDANTHKACWVLELVCYEKLEWLVPYLDVFCSSLNKFSKDSAIRPLSKICMLLTQAHVNTNDNTISLSENNLKKITEACFDWLITDNKVAAKAYSIRTLFALKNHFDWIQPELKQILEQDYKKHSAAYQAVAREVLKKMK